MPGFGIVQCIAPLDSGSCSRPGRARLGRVLDNSAGYVILEAAKRFQAFGFVSAQPPQLVQLVLLAVVARALPCLPRTMLSSPRVC